MTSQFSAIVGAYCLGHLGRLSPPGARRLPWLQIIRCETEKNYLEYQCRILARRHGPGATHDIDSFLPRVNRRAFFPGYHKVKLRFHAPELAEIYPLIYPRDEFRYSEELLYLAGLQGVAALWLDTVWPRSRTGGRLGIGLAKADAYLIGPRTVAMEPDAALESMELLRLYLAEHGIKGEIIGQAAPRIALAKDQALALSRLIAPYVPRCMAHLAKPPKR